MDETLSLSQESNVIEELIKKGFSIKSDVIANNLEEYISSINSKRSGKVLKLSLEKFRYDVYTRNQSRFITDRPIKWAAVIEAFMGYDNSYIWLN